MTKILKRFAIVLVLGLIGFGLWARLLAGGPVSIMPGGWIRGEAVEQPVADWTFAGNEQYLLVESSARLLPYSARVWYMVREGRIYLLLPALFGNSLQQRLEEDPLIRIGIDGRVYTQRAVAVEADAFVGELMAPVLRRIGSIELDGAMRRAPEASKLEGATMAIYTLENV